MPSQAIPDGAPSLTHERDGTTVDPLAPAPERGFAEPVLPAPAQDPHVTRHGGLFYYCESTPRGIFVRTAVDPLAFAAAAPRCVWSPPRRGPVSRNLWAPELHQLDGRFHIYFAADDGDNAHHRMAVLAALTSDPAGPYELAGTLDTGGWAIDGTVLAFGAERYLVWSGWPGDRDGQQDLYLAPMSSPTRLAAPRCRIAVPDQAWERHGLPICEGPQVLARGGRTFIVYSASGSWTEHYQLGLLELRGSDPLAPDAWHKLGSVFSKNGHGWGVGHGSFATLPDGRDWLFYHAKTSRRPGWADRAVRAQPFTWSASGYPVFGGPRPVRRGGRPASTLAFPPTPLRLAS